MTSKTGIKAVLVAGLGAVVAAGAVVMVGQQKKKKELLPGKAPGAPAGGTLTGYPVPPLPQVPAITVPGTTVTTPSVMAPGVSFPPGTVSVPTASVPAMQWPTQTEQPAQVAPAQVIIPKQPTADLQQMVANAIASGDPAKMRQVATQLRAAGNTTGAQALEVHAKTVETTNAAIASGVQMAQQVLQGTPITPTPAPQPPATPALPAPAPTPTVQPVSWTPSVPVSMPPDFALPTATPTVARPTVQLPAPAATGPVWPVTDPAKVAVAQKMVQNLVATKPYKENTSLVKAFQAQERLSPVDGLYGAGTATTLGQRYGIIPPKPFYWSKTASKVPAQKAQYQADMLALAAKDPARAPMWQAAGNVYSTAPAPVSTPPASSAPALPSVSALPAALQTVPGLQQVVQTAQAVLPSGVEGVLASAVAWPVTDPTKISVANQMNMNLAGSAKYKENQSLVKAFQAQSGISPADGLYGPGTALKLAQDYGIIPTKPFYWSKTTSKVPGQKSDYRAALTALSVKDPLRAAQWLAAAQV